MLQASLNVVCFWCTLSCCFLNQSDILAKHRNWWSLRCRILQDYLVSAVLPSIWLKNIKHFLCMSALEVAGDFVEHKILHVHCMYFKQLSPNPRQAPSGTLQPLLHTNLEPGMLVLSWLYLQYAAAEDSLLLSCKVWVQHLQQYNSSFMPEEPLKSLAPTPLFKAFWSCTMEWRGWDYRFPSTTIGLTDL